MLALASSVVVPSTARACGGFACSARVPVVQAGEQVVYVIGADGSLTMSVRILYTGAAPEFAWILPVPETPVITLGHESLFARIEAATRPTFSLTRRTEGTCRAHPSCDHPTGGILFADAAARSDSGPGVDGGGPTIFAEGAVGPYETVVLGGGTTAEIIDWLMMRGYDIPASMAPLLDDYVAAGQRFVALRLRNDASSSDIQPITLGFGGVLPCLPIRLTAVATAPNLPITTYFLADARVAPRNYSLVESPYPTSLYLGASYTGWVASEVASLGGHAFATDFAGPTASLGRGAIGPGALADVSPLATQSDLDAFVAQLSASGYTTDPLLPGLIARHLTPPAGFTAAASYVACVLSNGTATCGVPLAFDPAGAALAIDEAITEPRRVATSWVLDRPYLTRLSTTMTAADMTIDPEFVLDAGLEDVPNVHSAIMVTECTPDTFVEDARVRLDIDDGRSIEIRPRRESVSDALYCVGRGGWLPGSRRGCHVSRARATAMPVGAVFFLAAVVALVGRRSAARRAG